MKKIAIIGAGICGLRAMIEFSKSPISVHVFEKSKSLGGRIATRRFENSYVNHGMELLHAFNRLEDDEVYILLKDVFAPGRATTLPKTLSTLTTNTKMNFESKIDDISRLEAYDAVILTQPIPQVLELLGDVPLLDQVSYSKKLVFIGAPEGKPIRLELSDEDSGQLFEDSEESIRHKAESILGADLSKLDLKKWRYCRVLKGLNSPYMKVHDRFYIAGDAFDPEGIYDLAAAWKSGQAAAKAILAISKS